MSTSLPGMVQQVHCSWNGKIRRTHIAGHCTCLAIHLSCPLAKTYRPCARAEGHRQHTSKLFNRFARKVRRAGVSTRRFRPRGGRSRPYQSETSLAYFFLFLRACVVSLHGAVGASAAARSARSLLAPERRSVGPYTDFGRVSTSAYRQY